MSPLTHYIFKSVWHVKSPRDRLIEVLYDIESYPVWWPEIREVRSIGERRVEVVARSLLPYELRFVSEADPFEPSAHLIERGLRVTCKGTYVGRSRSSTTAAASPTTRSTVPTSGY